MGSKPTALLFDFGGTLGFQEIEGVHNRGDFDLMQHQQFSGKKLEYFDQPNNRRYTPYVVETSVGADRTTLAVLVDAYHEETVEGEDEGRTVLKLQSSLAPVKAGIFPLVKKDGMPEMAHRIADDLRASFPIFYDDSGAIGRRYRRQDEVGTPFGITVDGESMTNEKVYFDLNTPLRQLGIAGEVVESTVRGAPDDGGSPTRVEAEPIAGRPGGASRCEISKIVSFALFLYSFGYGGITSFSALSGKGSSTR